MASTVTAPPPAGRWSTVTVSGRVVAPGVVARSVATSSTFSSPVWADASTMAPDPGSSAAADGTAAANQRCAPQPTPAAMTINAATATAATRSRFGRRLTGASSGASAGSSRVAPSVKPACAAVRRVRVSSIRFTRVVASTAASSAVGVPLVVAGSRSAVRSPRGRSRACVRSPAARSLPCARPTGLGGTRPSLPPGCGLRALTRLRRRARPAPAPVCGVVRRRTGLRSRGRRPACARWLRRRARACAREGRRPACALPPPYRSPACARPGPRCASGRPAPQGSVARAGVQLASIRPLRRRIRARARPG